MISIDLTMISNTTTVTQKKHKKRQHNETREHDQRSQGLARISTD